MERSNPVYLGQHPDGYSGENLFVHFITSNFVRQLAVRPYLFLQQMFIEHVEAQIGHNRFANLEGEAGRGRAETHTFGRVETI